ncbi:MAG: HAMP domain-containing sensor histidine kinase [Eubacteriales bacterium]|nr:HAMP domain-containing sensor histidine kinase [Eubacteriales bacterium]
MSEMGIAILLLCVLATGGIVLWDRRKVRKTMDKIETMLEAAMDGSFSEATFDESRLSALETKLAHYLSAAELSSQKAAQEKDKIKSLIADISHQTKTPIANLLLYSELLMEEKLPDSARANVEALYSQSEKLRFFIDALVKLSRLENGIISLSPQCAALQPLLQGVAEQYAAKAAEKGLSLQLQDTDAFAVFDARWTAEALANIVDNAVKYTAQGAITICAVSYEMFARIDISDTGEGIPESEQAKIFARFYRSKAVRDKEGVGIGLYLSRQIISGEGGYIKVVSVPGQGSTFSVFLPKSS